MRISLLTKFFFSFLITGAVMVAVLISLIEFYGFRNFSDYVAQKEYNELASLVPILETAYGENGSWDFLEHNPRQWLSLLYQAGLIPENMPPPPEFGPESTADFSPRYMAGPGERRPPSRAGHPPPGPMPNDLGPRISLLDLDKHIVMGRHLADAAYLRPVAHEGTIVGYLGFSKALNLSHPLDVEFLKQQKKSFLLAGALFLAGSVLVSVILAFHLLSPIRKLSKATRDLGQRKFDTRINLRTRDELGQLSEEFNRMAVTLGDYEKRQVQWLSDISHELRTPLSILKGELEAVQDGIRPLEEQTIDALHGEVGHLIRLVSDLHDLSMAEARMMRLTLTRLDLSVLVAQLLDRFRHRFNHVGIEVSPGLSPGLVIEGDQDRLTQLFSNLLENGLAYTDPPGRISICCSRHQEEIMVVVENSGPGVAPHLLPRLFDRLFRAEDSRNRKNGGSGLGLAICRHIVLAHHGRIQALQSPLGGIKIEVCLPGASKTEGETT